MQSSNSMHGVSFRKNPRDGQKRVFDKAAKAEVKRLNIELPTGYGKTITALGAFSIRKNLFGVNRLLYITPTDAQHEQFINDGPAALRDVGVSGPVEVCDIRFFGVNAIKRSLNNTNQVFATTIQSLNTASGKDILKSLLMKSTWMSAIDELHHYGIGKPWGDVVKAIRDLGIDFELAMSATPHRPDDDSIFGSPDIRIEYRDAVAEGAVKKLVGHSYIYKIDAVGENGDVISYTTDDLIAEAGGDSPEQIERLRIERKMRWSPKYVSPLVSVPIERMLRERLRHGVRFQVLIGALCVSHAELVCEQIRAMFPELKTDWVGTGLNGRDIEINRQTLKKFCPPKDVTTGLRPDPTIDVLVHVGMAGEGLDTSLVTEVVHLNGATVNNSNNQENGRAARVIYTPDGDALDVVGNINFDSSSGYAENGYKGEKIMDAMSFNPPSPDDEDDEPKARTPSDIDPIPETPLINIYNMALLNIDSGSPEVQLFAKTLQAHNVVGINYEALQDDQSEMDKVIDLFRAMRAQEAEGLNSRAVIAQLDERVETALSLVVTRVIRLMTCGEQRIEKSTSGDLKRRINIRKKRILGEKTQDEEVLRRHYSFLHNLDSQLAEKKEIPSWLQ